MRLSGLAKRAGVECPEADEVTVTGFAIDHRKVAPGTVFGAFRGAKFNAEDFIPAAVDAGAVAVVARPEAVVETALHIPSSEPRQTFAQHAPGAPVHWATGASPDDEALIAHGQLDGELKRSLRAHEFVHVVAPCARALFERIERGSDLSGSPRIEV